MAQEPNWMQEDHILLREAVRRFFAAELLPNKDRWRAQGQVDRDFWRRAGQAGLLAAAVPETYGGAGGDFGHDAVIFLEQGRVGDSDWGFSVHNIATHYVLTYGNDEQKQRWLPKLASGELVGAIAMTEPGTGSDLQAVRTAALAQGDWYRINGSKTFITNGQLSNLIILVAKTDPAERAKGISLIVVETDGLEGFRRGRNLEKIGQKGQDTSELFFEDVRVPRANVLGSGEGQGFYQMMEQLPWERLLIALVAVGISEYAIKETLGYVRERKAFGKPLLEFQNTRFKLAEAKTKLEVTRAFVDRCMEQVLAGELDAATASMAKWWSGQMQCEIVDECLQLHGGYGYMLEYPIARLYTDSRVQKIYGGTNEIMKELIARSLND